MDISKLITKEMKGIANLIEAKTSKESEIKEAYNFEESNSTITINTNTYSSNSEHLVEIDLERRLALDNSESDMLIFDIEDNPHNVTISNVLPVMQHIRSLTKDRRIKARGYLSQINNASTVEEVDLIVWE